jgi:hypothetical protein
MVNASYLDKLFNDKAVQILLPIAEQLLWLNLDRTNVTNDVGPVMRKSKKEVRLQAKVRKNLNLLGQKLIQDGQAYQTEKHTILIDFSKFSVILKFNYFLEHITTF